MMKRVFLTLCLAFAFAGAGWAQGKLPAVNLKDVNGKASSSADWENGGKPMVISFWATWCKPCIQELSAIHEQYEDWQKETGVKLVAVSIDDARNESIVRPFVEGRGWSYDVFLDPNSDFKRAMNVNNVPHTFLLKGDGTIVWQHTSYLPGDEDKLFEEIKKLAAAGK